MLLQSKSYLFNTCIVPEEFSNIKRDIFEYGPIRAEEIAALKLGDVFDAEGRVREQFTHESDQTKGGHSHISTTQRYIDVNADQMK